MTLGWRRQRVTNQIDFAGCGLDRHCEVLSRRSSFRTRPAAEAGVPWSCTHFKQMTALGADDPTFE